MVVECQYHIAGKLKKVFVCAFLYNIVLYSLCHKTQPFDSILFLQYISNLQY